MRATAKYVNKVVEVTGTIQSVKPGENNALTISLNTGSDISSVILYSAGKSRDFKFQNR